MAVAKLPRGIYRHRGDRYRVRASIDGTLTSLGVFDTLGDAKAALAIARGDEVRGTFTPPAVRKVERRAAAEKVERESVTLAEWAESWLSDIESGRLVKKRGDRHSQATIVSYRSVLRNHVLPVLGTTKLVDLTPDDVSDLLAAIRAKKSSRHPGSDVNGVAPNVAIVLRSCLNAAVKRGAGGLTAFAFPSTQTHVRVRPEDPDGEVATPAEVEALTATMPDRLRIAVPLAAWCALRLGEALGLERRDLERLDDPGRATLHVRRQFNVKAGKLTPPKAGSTRSVAIPEFLLDDLREHLDAFTGTGPESPVLTNSRLGRVSQTRLDVAWRAARVAAGRPTLLFHGLRHTGLTIYAQQGATLAELLERGGHSDVSVALRYQHATAERDRALTRRLAAVVTEG